jgi:hypothetical protein
MAEDADYASWLVLVVVVVVDFKRKRRETPSTFALSTRFHARSFSHRDGICFRGGGISFRRSRKLITAVRDFCDSCGNSKSCCIHSLMAYARRESYGTHVLSWKAYICDPISGVRPIVAVVVDARVSHRRDARLDLASCGSIERLGLVLNDRCGV